MIEGLAAAPAGPRVTAAGGCPAGESSERSMTPMVTEGSAPNFTRIQQYTPIDTINLQKSVTLVDISNSDMKIRCLACRAAAGIAEKNTCHVSRQGVKNSNRDLNLIKKERPLALLRLHKMTKCVLRPFSPVFRFSSRFQNSQSNRV